MLAEQLNVLNPFSPGKYRNFRSVSDASTFLSAQIYHSAELRLLEPKCHGLLERLCRSKKRAGVHFGTTSGVRFSIKFSLPCARLVNACEIWLIYQPRKIAIQVDGFAG